MKTSLYEKRIAWNNIKGNGLLKRAIEIALSGQHTITIIGNPDNGKEYLDTIFKTRTEYCWEDPIFNENLFTFVQPCFCGNFIIEACNCSVEEIASYRKTKEYVNAMKSQIIVKLERPLFNEIVSVLTGEPFTDVMYRIDTFNKLKTVKSTDQDAMEFLKTAYNKLLFTGDQINRVLAVSKTIAIMDNSEVVQAHHMAEAIQYQALDY